MFSLFFHFLLFLYVFLLRRLYIIVHLIHHHDHVKWSCWEKMKPSAPSNSRLNIAMVQPTGPNMTHWTLKGCTKWWFSQVWVPKVALKLTGEEEEEQPPPPPPPPNKNVVSLSLQKYPVTQVLFFLDLDSTKSQAEHWNQSSFVIIYQNGNGKWKVSSFHHFNNSNHFINWVKHSGTQFFPSEFSPSRCQCVAIPESPGLFRSRSFSSSGTWCNP